MHHIGYIIGVSALSLEAGFGETVTSCSAVDFSAGVMGPNVDGNTLKILSSTEYKARPIFLGTVSRSESVLVLDESKDYLPFMCSIYLDGG